MPEKLVSIIIPTYNRASLLIKAITSVKNQNYAAIQIIVADDGSEDNTEQIVSQFEGVEYYRQENKGQAAARNLGLQHAKGEYIASLDSDDIWDKNFIVDAVAALERFEADFVFLNWAEYSGVEDDKVPSGWERGMEWIEYAAKNNDKWVFLDSEQVRKLFIKTCPAPSSALLIRRSSMVSGWNEQMKIADDWYLILEMILKKPCRAAFTITPYWLKHIHSSNIYHGRSPLLVMQDLCFHDEQVFAQDFDKQLTQQEKTVLKNRLGTHYFNFGRLNYQINGISLNALQSMITGFKIAPVSTASYLAYMSYYHLKNRFGLTKK